MSKELIAMVEGKDLNDTTIKDLAKLISETAKKNAENKK